MCLGKIPVEFPGYLTDTDVDVHIKREVQDLKDKYLWDPANAGNQWWIDGLTIDPSILLSNRKVIWQQGVSQPVLKSKMENASIGSLPKVTVYIAVHPAFGTHVFYPYHGAKHGGEFKGNPGKMYDGFQFWFSDFSEDMLQFIKERDYYNQERALVNFMKVASPARKVEMGAGFHAKNFIVRFTSHALGPCQNCLATSSARSCATSASTCSTGKPAVLPFLLSFFLALSPRCSGPFISNPDKT